MKRFNLSGAASLWLLAAIIAITAMAFTACSKKSERTEGSTQQQTAAAPVNPHPEILNGDFSAFAGIWAAGNGDKRQLRADGFYSDGSYGDHGIKPYRFDINGNGANMHYSWMILDGMDINLYPAGADIITEDNQVIQSDTTKARITMYPKSSDDIFYLVDAGYSGTYVNPYALIMNSDFSAFAGRWVNDHGGGSVELTPDGLLRDIGYGISNLRRIGNAYSWDLSTGVVSMPVFLFPAGVEVTDEDNRRVQTDTTKDRIAIDRRYSNQVYYRQGEAQVALDHEELRAGSSVTGVVGGDWKERYNIRSVDTFYISLVIESEVEILLDVYNGQQFIKSSIDDSGEYHSRIEIAAQPNTVYLLEVSSYVRDVTEAKFRISAHLSQ
ncbi:MAG: hypothetical protein LBH16_02550 [Treponema sp.]|jgi:hypothetical protein|nr:hypothetical protein [Treponema sp.]